MQLNEKILIIYPELKDIPYSPLHQPPYIIQDDSDGRGAYIRFWNYSKPQPTQEQLDALDD